MKLVGMTNSRQTFSLSVRLLILFTSAVGLAKRFVSRIARKSQINFRFVVVINKFQISFNFILQPMLLMLRHLSLVHLLVTLKYVLFIITFV